MNYATEVTNLTYNAADQQFEALVILHEAGDRLGFPTSLKAPITADFETVARSLVVQAKVRRAQNVHELMSRLRPMMSKVSHAA